MLSYYFLHLCHLWHCDLCPYICHSGLVVRALDLGPEVPGSNLLLEATKFPPSTYSQTECMLNSTILKEQ